MAEEMTLDRVDDLPEADRAAVRSLTLAVYPPELATHWHGRDVEWAAPEWCVRIRDGNALVSYVGVYLRDAECDGRAELVGGVGNVKTHPSARRRGFAGQGIRRAAEFFGERSVAFGLLVCESHLVGYYAGHGWIPFGGRLLVRQRGLVSEFTLSQVMTLRVRSAGPVVGTIDLRGPPW